MKADVNNILNVMRANGYVVFSDDKTQYNLNLIAIRNSDRVANTFNDDYYCIYKYDGKWNIYRYNCTTDPGLVYRLKPINPLGTAIIKPGQYRGLWKLGLHKGKYPALVQKGKVTVYRDNDMDNELDMTTLNEDGHFGINCHKAGRGITTFVNNYSAGCVVFENDDEFDNEFLPMCRLAAIYFGNSFTFTLLTQEMFIL